MAGRRAIEVLMECDPARHDFEWGVLEVRVEGLRREAILSVEARRPSRSLLCSRVMRSCMGVVGLGLLLLGFTVIVRSAELLMGLAVAVVGGLMGLTSWIICDAPTSPRSIRIIMGPDGVEGDAWLFKYVAHQLDSVGSLPEHDPVRALAWDHAYDLLDPHAVRTQLSGPDHSTA